MSSSSASLVAFDKHEPIPGYITKELLGTGGCGEVWKCCAPGGLYKAVKIVGAGAHSKRAARELCSLNRIKEVRHPFLLSIERIEVVEGNVILVTELADQSLKRHYQKLRGKGLAGISRDELLGHLRDTADALDYIYDNYSLQHLDIKPENILLVGGRAKVADFGLVKNLYELAPSMVEGLTPLYAPPELFEGKPHRHSDQYSLAIVYQEMLTGGLPFDGGTAAQLAAQHLHVAPLLSSLPKTDQPIIARSLSKEPSQRFPNCRSLVEALVQAESTDDRVSKRSPQRRGLHSRTKPEAPHNTEELDPAAVTGAKVDVLDRSDALSRQLPSVHHETDPNAKYGPVLFIGIGGTAIQVLQRLRRRIHDRVGSMNDMPALDMLAIDTDIKSLNKATEGDPGMAIDPRQRLPMPLRPSEEYRVSLGNTATSISRRWLYNVPYSLQTEGFRPLGRLAMVDHSKQLFDRLRECLIGITDDENVARTSETTDRDFVASQPCVFIVASTAGGTGSGMVIDVAYAVRSVLAELDLPDGNVHGLLLHSTGRASKDRDKAVANTFATLSEIWHYSRPGHFYPADRACGIPAFHGNNRTFSTCYVVHLGDDLSELQFGAATDPIAEYLYANSLSAAGRFFDECRRTECIRWGTELVEPVVRTFGLSQLGGSNSEIPVVFGELLCRDLVRHWRSGLPTDPRQTDPILSITAALTASNDDIAQSRQAHIDSQAAAKAAELQVDIEHFVDVARGILEQEVPSGVESLCVQMIAEIRRSHTTDGVLQIANALSAIDARIAGKDESRLTSLAAVLGARMDGNSAKCAASFRDWLFDLVDTTDGTSGAIQAAEWFRHHLVDLQTMNLTHSERLREHVLSLQHTIMREGADAVGKKVRLWPSKRLSTESHSRLFDYAHLQIEQAIACAVSRGLAVVEAHITAERDRLQVFWKDLNILASAFCVPTSLDEAFEDMGRSESVPSHWQDVLGELFKRRAELVVALDREIEATLAVGPHKLRWHLTESRSPEVQLPPLLRAGARQLVLAAMQELNVSRLTDSIKEFSQSSEYRQCVEAARPLLGGEAVGSRLVLIIPQNIDASAVRQSLAMEQQQQATIVQSTDGEFIACEEAEWLEIRRVGAVLVNHRRDFVVLADRLHARVDVKWDDMLAPHK